MTAEAQSENNSQPSAAYTNALEAYDAAWENSGLVISKFVLTEAPSSGYGQYTPRPEAAYSDGEALSVYAEPVGYGFTETNGTYAYRLTASYKLLNRSGQVLAEETDFAEFSGSGRSKQRELSASLTFSFSGLPAGDYRLEAIFTDEVAGGTSGFTLPFSVTSAN